MANTLTRIASQTVGAGGSAEVSFTSIPQTYTDLKVLISARTAVASASQNFFIGINGNYTLLSSRYLAGTGTAAIAGPAGSNIFADIPGNSATGGVFGNLELYIPNYTVATNKQLITQTVNETNATAAFQEIWAASWASTAAINALKFSASNLLLQGSTFTIYGIKKTQ
jgi:hypothetical protein